MKFKKRFTKKELTQFKEKLLEIRRKLALELQHINNDTLRVSPKDAAGDLSSHTLHMADVASDSYDTEFRLGLASNEQELLNAVDLALNKVEDGSYGFCEKYGTPIPLARLRAMPYARYSLKAQQEEEKERRN